MKAMHVGSVAGLAAAVVAACAYLVADASARTLATSFATTETARHARSVAFTNRIARAPAEYWTEARYRTATNVRKRAMNWERIERNWKHLSSRLFSGTSTFLPRISIEISFS